MKKAQAALEFLSTYGWALIVVLVAIGALAYWGVLNADTTAPSQCIGPAGMDCFDTPSIKVSDNSVTFAVRNNNGGRINITGTASASGSCTLVSLEAEGLDISSNEVVVNNNDAVLLKANCAPLTSGRFKAEITLPYFNVESRVDHSATFTISGLAK